LIDGGLVPLFYYGHIMDNFLIEIVYEPVYGSYMAYYSNGQNILLGASTYEDAVLETDMLELVR